MIFKIVTKNNISLLIKVLRFQQNCKTTDKACANWFYELDEIFRWAFTTFYTTTQWQKYRDDYKPIKKFPDYMFDIH